MPNSETITSKQIFTKAKRFKKILFLEYYFFRINILCDYVKKKTNNSKRKHLSEKGIINMIVTGKELH
jgi:hypothetical protein